MKRIVVRIAVCLFMIWLGACRNSPNPTEIVPSGTVASLSTPTRPLQPGVTEVVERLFKIGDAGFDARSISVDSMAVAAADLNNDGYPDLVSAGENLLTILLGNGEGEFALYSRIPGGENPVDFAIADLNEDGNVDMAVANHDTDYLTILLGDGQGNFQPAPISPLMVAVLPHPHAVRAADLDADGHTDLVVDDREAEGVLILPGLGDGSFAMPGIVVGVGGDPYRGMAFGDLNGDGKLDLVTPNPGEVGVLLNASKEGIAFAAHSPVEAQAPFAVELGDFNRDGRLDLIAASDEGSPLVGLFLGDGNGGFMQASDSPLNFAPGGKKVAVGNFNLDGFQDAVISSYQSPEVLVLLGGDASFNRGYLPGGDHPWGLAVSDLNLDGKDDIVIADDMAQKITVYLSVNP